MSGNITGDDSSTPKVIATSYKYKIQGLKDFFNTFSEYFFLLEYSTESNLFNAKRLKLPFALELQHIIFCLWLFSNADSKLIKNVAKCGCTVSLRYNKPFMRREK